MNVRSISGVSSSKLLAKGMTAHAETLRAEIEYARFNKDKCGGFMNWMYSDIWPSATWAVVDYYLEPKQAYYQMKKSYAPVLLTYVDTKDGLNLALINDTQKILTAKITYGEKTLDGRILYSEFLDATVEGGNVFGIYISLVNLDPAYEKIERTVTISAPDCINAKRLSDNKKLKIKDGNISLAVFGFEMIKLSV